jgi:hypothetical protein
MSTSIVTNLTIFSDGTGHGNQSHLVYAVNQGRWWLFIFTSKTAANVAAYVSSSGDLSTATWSASTGSPSLTQVLSSNDQRNLGVAYLQIGSTDAVHVDVTSTASASAGAASKTAHIRATFGGPGTNTISWGTWNETTTTSAGNAPKTIKGNTVGISTGGVVHKCQNIVVNVAPTNTGDPDAQVSTNADTSASWTNGFGAIKAVDDSMTGSCTSYAFAALASNAMLLVFNNASVAGETNSIGLRWNKYTSGTTWPENTGNADVGIGTSSQDSNDWCLSRVDATHTYVFRRDSNTGILWRKFDGTSWSTPTSAVPTYNVGASVIKAGAGLVAVTDGGDLWLVVLDNGSNNPIYYCKCTGASGTTPSWGAWTQLEAAGSTPRNSLSGHPVVGNNLVGVIYTVVNGSNFDVAVSALNVTPPALDQYAFRSRNDDGSESAATWYANENANFTDGVGANLRLRAGVNASQDPASRQFQLEYRESGGAWKIVEK